MPDHELKKKKNALFGRAATRETPDNIPLRAVY